MYIVLGLLIIAVGAFCQSSSYVPIRRIKKWSWESFWLVQAVFAYVLFPLLGAWLTAPAGSSLAQLYSAHPHESLSAMGLGMLWGIGGLTFGLSMRYLGVALGQSLALGTCAGLGTLLGPVFTGHFEKLTPAVIIGVMVTLIGIAVIGAAGAMKSKSVSDEEKHEGVADFNFTRGIAVALLSGFMSACFAIGLEVGAPVAFSGSKPIFATLPATLLVTFGGFLVNAAYCLWQNGKHHTWSDYAQGNVWLNNLLFCALAGVLWYSQFFGLSLGKGFLTSSATLLAFSWCILMALNVTFSNVWGILLKEWRGCNRTTIAVLVAGLVILVFSTFLPQLLA